MFTYNARLYVCVCVWELVKIYWLATVSLASSGFHRKKETAN